MHGATYGCTFFLIMRGFKLDSFDTFTRAVDSLYVTMDACIVWLLWYHGWRDVWLLWFHAWRDVWIPLKDIWLVVRLTKNHIWRDIKTE